MYWLNQSKWLVKSIEMIGWINRNDSSNRLNPIEVNWSDWSDDRSQLNPIENLHFFPTLIDFDCLIDQFDCSIDHFDWVRSIRPINSIAFDWVRSIRSTIEFDCVRLTSPGIYNLQTKWLVESIEPDWIFTFFLTLIDYGCLVEFNRFDRLLRLTSIVFDWFDWQSNSIVFDWHPLVNHVRLRSAQASRKLSQTASNLHMDCLSVCLIKFQDHCLWEKSVWIWKIN